MIKADHRSTSAMKTAKFGSNEIEKNAQGVITAGNKAKRRLANAELDFTFVVHYPLRRLAQI
jgi:hypothetical protein